MIRALVVLLLSNVVAHGYAADAPRLLPAAASPSTPRAAAYDIPSRILGQTRRVIVRLPPSFATSAPSRRYPLAIVLDGDWLLQSVATASEPLVEHGQIPELVLVAIANTDDGDGRVHDLTPPGLSVSGSSLSEGGDRFLDFIERELVPALDAQFRTAAPRLLIGTSSGGILTTYAAATRNTFRLALALDTPIHLGDRWLAKKLAARAKAAGAPPLHYASIDARFGWDDASWSAVTSSAPPSWVLYREKLQHESHTSMQFLGAYLGLRELFRDYSALAAPPSPTTSIVPYYDRLAESYGEPLVPPQSLLRTVIDDLLMEGRGANAHAVLDTLVASYGAPRDVVTLREQVASVERLPPPTESVESLLATPFPTPDELRDYLGEWEGEMWLNPDAKTPVLLRLTVEDGHVRGAFLSWPEPQVKDEQPLQYLARTPDGLAFGFMNGMRPRGVLLHEAKRDGDTLTGTVRFGGINFVRPDGERPPTIHFVLRKKRQ
ncbi:MAG: hypothetical protein JO197_11935 [Acidobacteria bacterium]|nr:hypothetical protein [Acidobacteriota bacterium]MBV9476187.1 hypothetical protein [Acidobacteriota bacterium]